MIPFLLIFGVILGAVAGKFFGGSSRFAKDLLVASAGFLITVCVDDVFPEIYKVPNIGIFVIAGVLLQLFLENLTKGFEHGHVHHDEERILPAALVSGLFIHAFIEGIPLAENHGIFSVYLVGILFHNLPISFVLGSFLFGNKSFSLKNIVVFSLFAVASPLGIWLGKYLDPRFYPYFLALAGGIFLHISSVIIFESNKNHNVDYRKFFLVISGILLAYSAHFFK